jgi:hypothetical protein
MGVNALVLISMPPCRNSNKVLSRQRARGCWHGVSSMTESLDPEIFYQAWIAAHDISDALRDRLVAIREDL